MRQDRWIIWSVGKIALWTWSNSPRSHRMWKKVFRSAKRARRINWKKADRSHFHNKVNWYQQGERSSKYFFALEKYNYNRKCIIRLIKNDGSIAKEQKDILQEQFLFYRKLYTAKPEVRFMFLNNSDIKISDSQKQGLEQPPSLRDLGLALHKMPNDKTPGCDGLPCEFYKFFWNRINHSYQQAIEQAYLSGTLSISMHRAVLTLLPKKQLDTNYLKNWRPISLLNTDYKILAKTLA